MEAAAPETPSGPVVENLAARVYVHNLPWALTNEGLALHMSRCGVVRFASIMTAADGRSKQSEGATFNCMPCFSPFSIVEYSSPEEAAAAITNLTDSELAGRLISVREDRGARPPGEGPNTDRGASLGRGIYAPRGGQSGGGIPRGRGGGFVGGRGGGFVGGRGGGVGGFGGGGMMGGMDFQQQQRMPFKPTRAAGGAPPEAANSLFVGNLSWSIQWQDLKDAFIDYRPTYADVKHWPDGRSRGWGIVRFDTPEDASAAAAAMNGVELGGRAIEVREDKGPTPRLMEGGAGGMAVGPGGGGHPGMGGLGPQGPFMHAHPMGQHSAMGPMMGMGPPAGYYEQQPLVHGGPPQGQLQQQF